MNRVRNEAFSLDLEYDASEHQSLPHVVKFSGGRSSGMMLMLLLEQGLLQPERGDVVVFNNTSAEHPATYDFVRACSHHAEKDYGVPFFWIEYATYEDAHNGEWTRRGSYRLVDDQPYSESNPTGYRWRGEVFEELVSHQGFLPSRHTRICTTHLKLRATNEFLAEWFGGKDATEWRGHFHSETQMTDEVVIARHRRSRGKLDDAELLRKKAFLRSRAPALPEQGFADFSRIGARHMTPGRFADAGYPELAPMTGDDAVEYVSLIGLRADEPRRVTRVMSRNRLGSGDPERAKREMTDGEIVCTPLADAGIDNDDVLDFWEDRPWKLALPPGANLSNCVYCFMKGTTAIPNVRRDVALADAVLPEELRSVPGTPSDIRWWVDLEARYERRPLKRYKGRGRRSQKKVTIGFWGVDADVTYRDLSALHEDDLIAREGFSGEAALPCDCTD